MNSYEAMFILKSGMGNDDITKTIKQIQDIIDKNKGFVDQLREMGKQRLAYPIKKQKEGIYYILNFHMDADSVTKLKRSFVLNESILRVLITVQ